jgi:hypothetical protein
LLNVQIRNSIGVLTDDAFTQTNPPVITTQVSSRVNQTKTGVLSGSVAFTRYLDGENYVGGAGSLAVADALAASLTGKRAFRALGCFINSANGNPFENTPGVASGVGPYVSGMGTFGNGLYETKVQVAGGGVNAGDAMSYYAGSLLTASRNGYLQSKWTAIIATGVLVDQGITVACSAETYVTAVAQTETLIGVLKMAPDAVQTELVYDQRV